MRNLKPALSSYNPSSENSYLKLFQIANQNLVLFLKEQGTVKPVVRNYYESKDTRDSKRNERG